ncbi:MAG: acyl-CoA synthetase [Thermodesulfobacteriota bacterium]
MHLGARADRHPDKPALIFADQERTVTYRQLEQRSNRVAQALQAWGLRPGDGIAVVLANEEHFFDFYWAAMRSGLYFTPVNWHLSAEEVRYVVEDCDARVLVANASFADQLAPLADRGGRIERRISVGGTIPGFARYEDAVAPFPATRIADEREGAAMLYSSGTTGKPKGVRPPLPLDPAGTGAVVLGVAAFTTFFGLEESDTYLCPGPLYHAAPLAFTALQHRIGATALVMDRFDPERALRYVDRYRVTTSQWVPTHFVRMLKLPEDVRRKYDLSSLKVAIHAAAPCPIPVKEKMIEWLGPKIVEYYAGTEGGGTLIRSEEWLTHKGSVGRHWAGGKVWILDETGEEVTEPGVDGVIYFEAPEDPAARFRYHKDDAKTADTYRGRLFTLGDVGHLDAEGYLYLTDRRSHMIISGGVNIYPQEVENCLATHPGIDDVAVIGVPHEDMGEEVKAVVQLAPGQAPTPELARELIAYVRERIAHYKAPRSIDFVDALPRLDNGKIYKRLLRERYWAGHGSRLV